MYIHRSAYIICFIALAACGPPYHEIVIMVFYFSDDFIHKGGHWEDVPSQKVQVVSGVLFLDGVLCQF